MYFHFRDIRGIRNFPIFQQHLIVKSMLITINTFPKWNVKTACISQIIRLSCTNLRQWVITIIWSRYFDHLKHRAQCFGIILCLARCSTRASCEAFDPRSGGISPSCEADTLAIWSIKRQSWHHHLNHCRPHLPSNYLQLLILPHSFCLLIISLHGWNNCKSVMRHWYGQSYW